MGWFKNTGEGFNPSGEVLFPEKMTELPDRLRILSSAVTTLADGVLGPKWQWVATRRWRNTRTGDSVVVKWQHSMGLAGVRRDMSIAIWIRPDGRMGVDMFLPGHVVSYMKDIQDWPPTEVIEQVLERMEGAVK